MDYFSILDIFFFFFHIWSYSVAVKYIPGVAGSMIPEEAAIVIFKAQSNADPQPVLRFNATEIFIRNTYIQNTILLLHQTTNVKH